MASFLFFSEDGAGLALAYKVRLAGHDVKAWIEKGESTHLYDGLLQKVPRFEDGLKKGTILVFDQVAIGTKRKDIPQTPQQWAHYENLADKLRKEGYPVIGASSVADRLELDRTWGAEIAKRAGLQVPDSLRFNTLQKALEHAKAHRTRHVLKPHSNLETYTVYISTRDDGEDMIDHLQYLIDHPPKDLKAVELQEYIDGTQMSVEVWRTGDRFVGQNGTFEQKPLYYHGVGPLTGEVGSTIFYYPPGTKTKIHHDITDKMEKVLCEIGFNNGPIDANMIHDGKGSWFLEWSPRFGYPATYLQLYAVEDDWGVALEAIAQGKFQGFHPKPFNWFVGNRVWLPWWPSGKTDEHYRDYPIFSQIRKRHLPHISFVDVHFKDGRLRNANTDGELMCVTAGGNSIDEAQAKVHQLLQEIRVYPMGWNEWVGEGIALDDLKRYGFWLPAEQ